MVARATRVDPHAGPYAAQRALVLHPDDPLFARFRWRMEREQGTRAKPPRPARQPRLPIPGWLEENSPRRGSGARSCRSRATRWRCGSRR
jgi:hypothetical protein